MLIGPQNLALLVSEVRSRIDRAARIAGRDPAAVTLIAVSKAQSAELVRAAATAGVTDFGENYLQEALAKIEALRNEAPREGGAAAAGLTWHFIGALQSNKTRAISERFDWVHSLDRYSAARRLSEQRPFHAPPLNLCIQVALVPEPNKGGLPPAELAELAQRIAELPRLKLRGLMCVPPPQQNHEAQRPLFARLRELKDELNALGLGLDTLSMGMSADYEVAIAEGATQVRIGTALFGAR
ncbi:MAG TPA: YggS family pyridoxal phosphate-dependent enzyme [Steroidobacteraceae bacterium]|nr:YggS family pyridoxal phosphate-dependent enzyme [Steroidobacteraceae bacterium]